MFSRTTEAELRQWHRDVYHSPKTKTWGDDDVRFELVFVVSQNADSTIMDQMHAEQEEHGDLLILDVEEKYENSAEKAFTMFRTLLPSGLSRRLWA